MKKLIILSGIAAVLLLSPTAFAGEIKHGMYTPGYQAPDDYVDSGSRWGTTGGATISYSYSNLLSGLPGGISAADLRSATEEALMLWATYAPLHFVEEVDSGPVPSDTAYAAGSHPDLRIGHHYIDGDSGANVLAHAYYPFSTTDGRAGDVHFDNGNTWRLNLGDPGIDLLEVMVHELGHSLGLGHEPTSGNTAIMNPYYGSRYSGLGTSFLFQDDINGIRAIYGTGTGSVTPLGTAVPLPAAAWMGLGMMGVLGVVRRRRRQAA